MPKNRKGALRRTLGVLLLLFGLFATGYYLWQMLPVWMATSSIPGRAVPPPAPIPAADPAIQVDPANDPTAAYPSDRLFITRERSLYESGRMTLTIPRIGLYDAPVQNGTDTATLKRGACLYEYAQLPGPGNKNVSIAGHRDIDGSIFYDVDQFVPGDTLILTLDGVKYVYTYLDSRVVEPSDWSPIYTQGFSCLTLTTCTPIGVASHRLIVRASLTRIEDGTQPETSPYGGRRTPYGTKPGTR